MFPVRDLRRISALRLAGLFLSSTLIIPVVASAQQSASEYQVKAAYLYNFAKAGRWNSQALPPESNLIIGVLGGDEEFIRVLRDTLGGKIVNGHALEIRHLRSIEEVRFCQVAFFRSPEHLPKSSVSSETSNVLLVGEDKQFLSEGGMIALLFANGRVTYQVNSAALEKSNVSYDEAKTATDYPAISPESPRPITFRVLPDYPKIAATMKLTGAVQLQATVRPDGTVKQVRVIGGHPLLAEAASRALMQWRYEQSSRETTESVRISFGP